ncbi:MAG: SRPBCC family protein [Gammaproteobacteria bacterium]|nr:SRPBCC family protein [Gammaproteobacteria bacterium]
MHNAYITREIPISAEKLWNAVDDFGGIYRFHPYVESSKLLGGAQQGKGAMRECRFYDGTRVVEEIVNYQEGRAMEIEIVESSMPLKQAIARLEFTVLGVNRTLVAIQLRFQPKFGPFGWLMAKLMMKPMMNKMLSGLLKGLEDHLTTGRDVGKGGQLIIVQ